MSTDPDHRRFDRNNHGQFGPITDTELPVHAGEVGLHRPHADDELPSDLAVRATGGNPSCDLFLGRRQNRVDAGPPTDSLQLHLCSREERHRSELFEGVQRLRERSFCSSAPARSSQRAPVRKLKAAELQWVSNLVVPSESLRCSGDRPIEIAVGGCHEDVRPGRLDEGERQRRSRASFRCAWSGPLPLHAVAVRGASTRSARKGSEVRSRRWTLSLPPTPARGHHRCSSRSAQDR